MKNKGSKEKIIYYTDERNDEFSTAQITPRVIDENYCYQKRGLLVYLIHVFWYRIIATPLAFLYMKLYFGHRIVNRKCLRQCRKTGCFLYGNHTHFMADPLVPTLLNFPGEVSVIVHPDNVSMPYLGRITPYLGALPLPDNFKAARNFMHAVKEKAENNQCIMIYPEAHIWPYYTDIRDFIDTSFQYPILFEKPVYCFTNTYQRRHFGKRPRMVTYVDGPFLPKEGLPPKMQRKQLRDEVYRMMKKRAQKSNVQMIIYRKAD